MPMPGAREPDTCGHRPTTNLEYNSQLQNRDHLKKAEHGQTSSSRQTNLKNQPATKQSTPTPAKVFGARPPKNLLTKHLANFATRRSSRQHRRSFVFRGHPKGRTGRSSRFKPFDKICNLMDKTMLIANVQTWHPPVLHVRVIAIGYVN